MSVPWLIALFSIKQRKHDVHSEKAYVCCDKLRKDGHRPQIAFQSFLYWVCESFSAFYNSRRAPLLDPATPSAASGQRNGALVALFGQLQCLGGLEADMVC